MEEIYYRNINAQFKAIIFKKTDIKTITRTILNFYEKYVLLILKDKMEAENIGDLSQKLSKMLNVKEIIILDFVRLLKEMGMLICRNGIYSLSEEVQIACDEKNEEIMVANLNSQEASMVFVYLLETGNLLSYNFLQQENIKLSRFSKINSDNLKIKADIISKKEIGKEIAKDSLKKTIASNFAFNLDDFKVIESCVFELPVKIEYIYSRTMECGIYSNCELDMENEYIKKYIKQEDVKLKIKTQYGIDNKKPDYIILEEQLAKEKLQLQEIDEKKEKIVELEQIENENSNNMKKLDESIELKNKTIKNLKQEIDELKQETEEYQRLKGEYQKQEEEKKALKEQIEKLRLEQENIKENKKKNKTEIYTIQTSIQEEHQKILTDDFDRKLEQYKIEIDKIDNETNYKLFEEASSLYNTLLSLSKKINNDSKDLHREWTNLYASYSVYIKVLLCYMLKLQPELFNSIKSIVDNVSATELGIKYGVSIDTCRDLKTLETIIDTGRHRIDSLSKIKQDLVIHKEDEEKFIEYISSSKENRKRLLLATFDVFLKGKFNKQDYTKINEMCILEAERTGKI